MCSLGESRRPKDLRASEKKVDDLLMRRHKFWKWERGRWEEDLDSEIWTNSRVECKQNKRAVISSECDLDWNRNWPGRWPWNNYDFGSVAAIQIWNRSSRFIGWDSWVAILEPKGHFEVRTCFTHYAASETVLIALPKNHIFLKQVTTSKLHFRQLSSRISVSHKKIRQLIHASVLRRSKDARTE